LTKEIFGHAKFRHSFRRHVAQALIKRARADEEAGVQHDAADLALENPGAKQIEHALNKQFGAAIDTGVEAFGPHRGVARRVVAQRGEQLAIGIIVVLAQHKRSRNGIAERTDTDLQCAAIGHQARRMQAHRVVIQRHWLARRSEERKIGRRTVQQHVELAFCDGRVAAHERQFGIGLPGEQEIGAAVAAQRQELDRQVRIAA
jgi:hypothetical protein